ncbi:hypothetical protein BSZ35_18935 [Salinibacter sp. 10B]|uniref:hypothetical protein n=1 Tax=Salinibacter sp. 10B TaxID=1923971 RepID=UPI000CF38A6B|nr:hypothetical protein [Salinibacter sp. 10B]PQJ26991.1 hypothetical protein BSZ35_18935 [Salinibacter sp. 10B]
MSSSRSTIDEALSPDDLGALSKIMFGDDSSSSSPGSGSDTEASDSVTPDSDNPGSETYARRRMTPNEVSSFEEGISGKSTPLHELDPKSDSGRGTLDESTSLKADASSSKRNFNSDAGGTSSNSKNSSTEDDRPAERPSFTIYADQAATLRVLAGSKADPLGATASEIAGRALDLLGYNGRHPAAALHRQFLSERASAPGPLIEARQWKDLLEQAAEMATASMTRPEAHLTCVCFLVQEALYEAGFGDRRRRRKGPF